MVICLRYFSDVHINEYTVPSDRWFRKKWRPIHIFFFHFMDIFLTLTRTIWWFFSLDSKRLNIISRICAQVSRVLACNYFIKTCTFAFCTMNTCWRIREFPLSHGLLVKIFHRACTRHVKHRIVRIPDLQTIFYYYYYHHYYYYYRVYYNKKYYFDVCGISRVGDGWWLNGRHV